jgi:flagellar hook-associated protein FlgK
MSDLVSVASSAVNAYQRALGTVSNNIANVDTEGYSKQEVELNENSPRLYGTAYLGTGVRFDGVRRLYDAFVEDSLRNANTDLGTQESLVNYANRVVNVLGSEDVGLLSAFDQFFDAARQLSTDSSSLILRSQFLSKAEGLAGQFGNLSAQLGLVNQETKEAIDVGLAKVNQLAEQLNVVNQQLRKSRYLERQPPALMDQRDQVLREMAKLVKIQVKEAVNGEVTVSIGSTITRGVVVGPEGSRKVSAEFSETSVGKVDLLVGRYSSSAESVAGLSGGEVAGLLNFRSQLLEPVYAELDSLAKTLVEEVNQISREGIDLNGQDGGDLFAIDPQFRLRALEGETRVVASPQMLDWSAYKSNELEITYRADAAQVNNITLTGDFIGGDQITVTLNSNARSFTLIGPTGELGEPLSQASVLNQLRQFLQGGNGASLDGAFGRQISVSNGAADDLLISSSLYGAYSFEVSSTSQGGRVANTETRGLWTVTDTVTKESASGVGGVDINGMRIVLDGEPRAGEILRLSAQNRPAAGMRVVDMDPTRLAAAGRFRVIENQFNPSGTGALVREAAEVYPQDDRIALPNVTGADGVTRLDNNALDEEAIVFDRLPATPIALIPAGYSDTTLYLGELAGSPTDLQVFTRDGRHLVGRQMADDLIAAEEQALGRSLTADERDSLIDQAGETFLRNARLAGASFVETAGYSDQYLNAQQPDAYRDMSLFYGVKAAVQNIPVYNEDHVIGSVERLAAAVESGLVPTRTAALGDVIFAADELELNGVSMGSLTLEQIGADVRLVARYTDGMGQDIRKVIDTTVTASAEAGLYNVDADNLLAWIDANPGWGRGETQEMQFGRAEQSGAITIHLQGEEQRILFDGSTTTGTIQVNGVTISIPSGRSGEQVAQLVATALEADGFLEAAQGRALLVQADGSLVVRFGASEGNVANIAVTANATGVGGEVLNTRGYESVSVVVQQGWSESEVASAVASAFDQSTFLSGLSGRSVSLRDDGKVLVELSKTDAARARFVVDTAATGVSASVVRDDGFEGRLGRGETQTLTFTEATAPGDVVIGGVVVALEAGDSATAVAYKVQQALTTATAPAVAFVDEVAGRSVTLNADGSLTVRFPASEGDADKLVLTDRGATGVLASNVTDEFKGLVVSLRDVEDASGAVIGEQFVFQQSLLGQSAEQTLYFGDAAAAGVIDIGGVQVEVLAGTTGAEVAAQVKVGLEQKYGSSSLSGSQREYLLNLDGSLTVRFPLDAIENRRLTLDDAGNTGISLRTEDKLAIPVGQEPRDEEIRLGLGQSGNTLSLAALGFRTGVYVSGAVKEDLLVFTTGPDAGAGFALNATYTVGEFNAVEALRAEPFEVVFTSPTQYQILDLNTGTVVANRRYDPAEGIAYRGVVLELSGNPMNGDRFRVDGNQDGIGNNGNALRYAELQNKKVMGGGAGATLADAYGAALNAVGNTAFQASVAKTAFEVVRDQAVQARDRVSGVSLDEEAADLIRYQQAYQASAKVIQTANVLFDAILGIR